jgi:uncharacterized membrane protein YfcA
LNAGLMDASLLGVSATMLALGALIFIAGGIVKGMLGIGLPLVLVPLLSLGMPATRAIATVAVPVLLSNGWQAYDTGFSWAGVRRFLPLIATLLIATLITVPMTLAMSEATLRTSMAVVLLIAVALIALPLHLRVPPSQERWWSAGVGVLSGLMGGVSSLTGPIIISYLVSLRLPRDVFVGTISVIYLAGAIPLYGSMAAHGRITLHDVALSALALLPMALGLRWGKWLRGKLSEVLFRRVLLGFLVLVAISLIFKR